MAASYTSSPVAVTALSPAPQTHPATKYRHVFMGLGIAQILIGVICLVMGIVLFVFLPLFYIGTGVWGGVWYIITGSLGVSIASSPNNCNAIAGLVISIIAAVVALVHGILDALGAVVWTLPTLLIHLTGLAESVVVGLYGTASFLAFVQLVLAIIHASFCGMAGCTTSSTQGQVLGAATVMPVHQGYGQQYYAGQAAGGATIITNQQVQPPVYSAPPYQVAQPIYNTPPDEKL